MELHSKTKVYTEQRDPEYSVGQSPVKNTEVTQQDNLGYPARRVNHQKQTNKKLFFSQLQSVQQPTAFLNIP